jgi:uncharacterized protein YegL
VPRKRKAKRRTLVNYIIDESGSMDSVADKVRQGFNEYKQEVARNTDGELLFTVTKFDTEVEILHAAVPVSDVSDLDRSTYHPGGMTALYDAVARTIKAVERDVDENTKVITVIMTDGLENSSRENTAQSVSSLIKEKEKEGNWTFVFLGADQDAWAQARNLGMAQGNVMSYAGSGTRAMHSSLAAATVSATASPAASSLSFFRDARQSAEDYQRVDVDEPDASSSS